MQLDCLRGNENAKGDAIINPRMKFKAVDDIFNSSGLIDSESDDEMDFSNNTVIERVPGRISPVTI